MKKKTIFIIILIILALLLLGIYALVKGSNKLELGEGPLTCYVEGELLSDKYGNHVMLWEEGAAMQEALFDHSNRVRIIDGRFYITIHPKDISMYNISVEQQDGTYLNSYSFLAEDNAHIKIQITDNRIIIKSDGEEGRKHEALDSIEMENYKEFGVLCAELNDSDRKKEFFTEDYIWASYGYTENKNLTPAIEDSARNMMNYFNENPYKKYTEAGLKLAQRIDSVVDAKERFRINYYAEHPMLWALYDVLFAARSIYNNSADPGYYTDNMMNQFESYMKLYDDKLATTYPGHPVHGQIAEFSRLSPGHHYEDDYDLHTPDGKAVPISSLIKDKVALIDFWASWCGACRVHSRDMISVYEKYKDKGFTVVAIAREKNRSAMEKAMKKDGYPWPSYLEPMNDENRVWARNGVRGGGGGMILIDRNGTILSTSTDAKELEPLIKKALNID